MIDAVNLTVSGSSPRSHYQGPDRRLKIESQAAGVGIPYHALQPDKRHHTHTSREMQTRSTVNCVIRARSLGFREPSKASRAGSRGLDLKGSKSKDRPANGHNTSAPNAAMLKPFTTSLIASPKAESITTRSLDGHPAVFQNVSKSAIAIAGMRRAADRAARIFSRVPSGVFPAKNLVATTLHTFTAALQARAARRVAQSAGIAERHF